MLSRRDYGRAANLIAESDFFDQGAAENLFVEFFKSYPNFDEKRFREACRSLAKTTKE